MSDELVAKLHALVMELARTEGPDETYRSPMWRKVRDVLPADPALLREASDLMGGWAERPFDLDPEFSICTYLEGRLRNWALTLERRA